MLLDLVEVAMSHTGVNLGITFVNILKAFGVEEKVRSLNNYQRGSLTYITHALQILGITGDNASNNNSMIQYLGNTLDDFRGSDNQTWCFVHMVNLIAKSILKPFDMQKSKKPQSFNDVTHALADLAEGHDLEGKEEDDEDKSDDEEEDNGLDTSLKPIRTMLLKVCPHFVVWNTKLRTIPCSYAKLRLGSRTQQQFSCQHGIKHCPLMAFLHI